MPLPPAGWRGRPWGATQSSTAQEARPNATPFWSGTSPSGSTARPSFFRSLSRWGLWVLMLATSMVTSNDELAGFSGSIVPLLVTSLKWPRTVIMPRCLTANSTCV